MSSAQTDAAALIKGIRKNIDLLERSIASANHTIVQSKAMLVRLESARTKTDTTVSERATGL
jgi:hypothetical protein